MIPVPPCYYIMPLHLAGAFFLLPPEENISPSGGKNFFLPREVVLLIR